MLDVSKLRLKESRKTEKIYYCPACSVRRKKEDTKGHLYVNFEKGLFHCWACGFKGRLSDLDFVITGTKVKEDEKRRQVELPPGFVSLSESSEDFFPYFMEYAKSRGVTQSDIYRYNMGFTVDISDFHFGRLIHCHFDDDEKIDFFQGRAVLNIEGPKYFSVGEKPLLTSFDGQIEEGAIVEGFYDLIKSSKFIPTASLFQSKISKDRSKKIKDEIKKAFRKRIFLLLDSDACHAIIPFMMAIDWIEIVPKFLPKKDLSEMNSLELSSFFRKIL